MKFVVALMAALAVTVPASSAFSADAKKGKKQFNRCKACHSVKAGKNKVGPSLHGIVGKKAASDPKYKYSKSLKAVGADKNLVWTEANLMEYLKDPTAFLKKQLGQPKVSNKMKNKFKKEVLRANIIAYLKTVK